jgi:hypothetical protein
MSQEQTFNPANVPIYYTLSFQQVNLLLEGLGKLPYERVEQLYVGLRTVALQTLQAAEQAQAQPDLIEAVEPMPEVTE